jgi:STE24 endopeptidase
MEIGYVTHHRSTTPVILKPHTYIKAASYKISSERLSIVSALLDYVMFIFWIGYGLYWLDTLIEIDNILLKSTVYILAFIGINFLLSLPLEIYKTFKLDLEYGFTKITKKLFVIDTIKSIALTVVFGGLVAFVISYIIQEYDNWWLYGFIFIFIVILFINMIYPTLIAPIFNKFTILEDVDLKSSIEDLMNKSGLKAEGIFTIDASKRDSRLNAYFGGLGKSKRVVLYDTLVEKLSKSELLSVLGHELGHFKHKDIIKNIAMMGALMFGMFYIFGNLPSELFVALNLEQTPYIVLVIFLLFSPILSFLFMPLFGMVSRKNEYEADRYGSECESEVALADALEKLANENKSFPKSHPIYIFFYFTHPPLVERLKRLGKKIDS